jgi:Zn-dependent peptidase ImmA (M78 family)/transcriptional regulator with XRE-family HTH domain
MINGDRIRQAREIKGLTQAELASKVGVSQSAIAQLESNSNQLVFEPLEAKVDAIAFHTRFPKAFFYQDSAPEFPLGSLLYRHRSSLLKREDKCRFHQLGRLVYELADKMVANGVRAPEVTLPKVVGEQPSVAAGITRAKLGLSPDTPAKNLLNRLEKSGVFVFMLPDEVSELDSYSVWADTEPRRPVIVLCGAKSGDRQRYNLAHELGHLVMHHSFPDGLKNVEREANLFAAALLLPKEAMMREILPPITLTSLAAMKPRWGVSIAALIERSVALGIITDRQARYLRKQKRDLKWDKQEPENLYIKPEKPRGLKRMAEVLHGFPANAKKLAAYNNARVSLVHEILVAHAEKPSPHKQESEPTVGRTENVIQFRKKGVLAAK